MISSRDCSSAMELLNISVSMTLTLCIVMLLTKQTNSLKNDEPHTTQTSSKHPIPYKYDTISVDNTGITEQNRTRSRRDLALPAVDNLQNYTQRDRRQAFQVRLAQVLNFYFISQFYT